MKYIIVIGDGMADNPVAELGDKTPLEVAEIPVMDKLAAQGVIGSVRTVPQGVEPGSDTAILSIFGYDPRKYYSGRSPLEAAGAGVQLEDGDVSYRCNMVALEGEGSSLASKTIVSHNGGSIDGAAAVELMQGLLDNPEFAACAKENGMSFHISPSFRHIAVQKGANIESLIAAPPHDHLGEQAGEWLPKGNDTAAGLVAMMELAHQILDKHPVNEKRRAEGKLPANGLWFWAEGTAIALPNFYENHRKNGFVISAVPLVRGIGALGGLPFVEVEGTTGELDTNYEGKADAAVQGLLDGKDFVVVHVEAPDECTHNGDTKGKLQAIEWLDKRVIGRLVAGLNKVGEDFRLLILSDHKTLTSTRGHDADPVPYILYDSRLDAQSGLSYSEANGGKGRFVEEGHQLIYSLLAN